MIVKGAKIGLLTSVAYSLWLAFLEISKSHFDIKRNTVLLICMGISTFWIEAKSKNPINTWKITTLVQYAVFILIFSYFFSKSAEWIFDNIIR